MISIYKYIYIPKYTYMLGGSGFEFRGLILSGSPNDSGGAAEAELPRSRSWHPRADSKIILKENKNKNFKIFFFL